MSAMTARSYLFVPGNSPERFPKACASGADAVIIDLEDAVAAADKHAARAAVAAWVSPAHPVFIRINGPDSEWFADDLALCPLPGVAGIVLPKAERIDDLSRVMQAGAARLLPLIETAHGFAQAMEVAKADGVQRLLFGSIDFQLDLGIDGGNEELLYFRSHLVLVSRLAEIAAPVDGVTTAIDDPQRVVEESKRARRLGFGAKLCIHPKQVPQVHAAFAPSEADLAWAKRVVEAGAAAHGAAIAVDGRMVDRPVILRAQAMIDEAARRG